MLSKAVRKLKNNEIYSLYYIINNFYLFTLQCHEHLMLLFFLFERILVDTFNVILDLIVVNILSEAFFKIQKSIRVSPVYERSAKLTDYCLKNWTKHKSTFIVAQWGHLESLPWFGKGNTLAPTLIATSEGSHRPQISPRAHLASICACDFSVSPALLTSSPSFCALTCGIRFSLRGKSQ